MAPSSTPALPSNAGKLYFGFGSNLCLEQMAIRCPTSTYLGIARLDGYRWIINNRGYANVVQVQVPDVAVGRDQETPVDNTAFSTDDHVWGAIFGLQPEDERRLDVNEGVPKAYSKETLSTYFWASKSQPKAPFEGWKQHKVDIQQPSIRVDMLVYIDRERTTTSKPKDEYVLRMNKGIDDALAAGVPPEYVDKVLRAYIPHSLSGDVDQARRLALKQAANFEDEN